MTESNTSATRPAKNSSEANAPSPAATDKADEAAGQATAAAAGPLPPRVIWDDSKMTTTFANVVNVLSTREEVALLFGSNQSWNAGETKELTIQLSNHIVLTPYGAKRLMLLLTNRIEDYESRYGTLNV